MTRLTFASLLLLAACQAPCPQSPAAPITVAPAAAFAPAGLAPAGVPVERTITVSGSAEVLTAPDCFELTVGFEAQGAALATVRDDSRRRAAALMAVLARHNVPAADIQTLELTVQPQHDYHEPRKIVGYTASRALTITLRDIDLVEPVLYDMLAAGANRVDHVQLHSSLVRERRAEARVLAVEAARAKAEAMAAALGQQLGQPLRIDEDGVGGGWRVPAMNNYSLNNETVSGISDTVAAGRIKIQASVGVTFALAPA